MTGVERLRLSMNKELSGEGEVSPKAVDFTDWGEIETLLVSKTCRFGKVAAHDPRKK
jgi:hypothetical protein